MSASWSYVNPRLQLAWDGTSLGALQKCPRYYQYTVIEGWRRPDNPHLDFGSLFQEAVEVFQLSRLAGLDIHGATIAMLRRAVQISGAYAQAHDHYHTIQAQGSVPADPPFYTWHPWGGEFVWRWRCKGENEYRNAKGNRAKCPNAKMWQDGARTEPCAVCLSPVFLEEHYVPDHPQKNRRNLFLALLLFAERQHETGGLQPYAFPDGTPAIEINLTIPMGRKAPFPEEHQRGCECDHIEGDNPECYVHSGRNAGEDYLLVSNFDEINEWRGRHYITDNKTTKNKLTTAHFRQFAPHAQFDFYAVTASIGLPDLDVAGIACRGIQVTKEIQDLKTVLLTKTPAMREETWRDINYWIDQAERYAAEGYWPMNRSACRGCEFAGICDMDPGFREASLDADFVKRGPWDPIVRPGRRDTGETDEG